MKLLKMRVLAILLAFCMLFSIGASAASISTFKDLDKNAWYADAIKYVLATGLMNGVEANKFAPNDNLTRAMLVTILYRAGSFSEAAKKAPFDDVPQNAYYADAVAWAKSNKIVNGTSDTLFSPDNNISREQIAAILLRFAAFKGINTKTDDNYLNFSDVNKISDYAVEGMNWAVGNGFINGRSDGYLAPGDMATRVEAAAILHRFLTGDHDYSDFEEPNEPDVPEIPEIPEIPEVPETPEEPQKPTGGGNGGGTLVKPETPQPPLPGQVPGLSGAEKWNTKVDYSDNSNWLSAKDMGKDVDVIYFYPTTYQSGADDLCDITDSKMRQGAAKAFLKQATVFENDCNIYAPFYRQVKNEYAFAREDVIKYSASQDCAAALDYYFENINGGRAYILAGHGQGSAIILQLLADYMKNHPQYYKNMVAAYVPGYSVTREYLAENPHLKFAESATDTGVIISYNTEGAENGMNAAVKKGALAINPINWQRDNTYALALDNMGSLDDSGNTVKGFADAQVDTERGVIICSTAPQKYKTDNPLFGTDSYHDNDYGLYYMNLRENAWRRIKAFGK